MSNGKTMGATGSTGGRGGGFRISPVRVIEKTLITASELKKDDVLYHIRAQALAGIGVASLNLADYETALNNLIPSIEYFENNKKYGERKLAILYHSAAIAYDKSGEWGASVKWYTKAEEKYRKENEIKNCILMIRNRGLVYLRLRQYEIAENILIECLEKLKGLDDQLFYAEVLSNIAALYDWQRKYQEALHNRRIALDIYKSMESWDDIVLMRNEVADSLLHMKKLSEAFEYIQSAENDLARVAKHERQYIECVVKTTKGEILLEQDILLESIESLTDAYSLAEKINDPAGKADIALNLGQAYKKNNKAKKAIEWLRIAVTLNEEVRGKLDVLELRSSFIGARTGAYDGLVALLADTSKEQALFYAESAKARTFLDAVSVSTPIRDNENQSKYDELETLRREIEHLRSKNQFFDAVQSTRDIKLTNTGEMQKTRIKHTNELDDLIRKYKTLSVEIKAGRPQHQVRESANIIKYNEFRNIINKNTAVIEYYIYESEIYVFVIRKKSLNCLKLDIKTEELNEKIKSVRNAIENKSDIPAPVRDISLSNKDIATRGRENLDELLASLGDILLGQVKGPLSGVRNLAIVPHGMLHLLPFHALKLDGKYLIETYAISYAPSMSVLANCLTKPKKEIRLLGAAGNPDGTLSASEEEVRVISQYVPMSFIRTGNGVSKDWVINAAGKHSDILHLACHAHFSSEAPLFSYLQLAPNENDPGHLTGYEILENFKSPDMVVLSACQTAVGEIGAGDEISSLTRVFFHAGASSVISTLWSVDDPATSELMKQFYAELRNSNRAEAMRKAQLTLLCNPEYSHPWFWAPFILVGDWRHALAAGVEKEYHYPENIEVWPPECHAERVNPYSREIISEQILVLKKGGPLKIDGIKVTHLNLLKIDISHIGGFYYRLAVRVNDTKIDQHHEIFGEISLATNFGPLVIPYHFKISPTPKVVWRTIGEQEDGFTRLQKYAMSLVNIGTAPVTINSIESRNVSGGPYTLNKPLIFPFSLKPKKSVTISPVFNFYKPEPEERIVQLIANIEGEIGSKSTFINTRFEPHFDLLITALYTLIGIVTMGLLCPAIFTVFANLWPDTKAVYILDYSKSSDEHWVLYMLFTGCCVFSTYYICNLIVGTNELDSLIKFDIMDFGWKLLLNYIIVPFLGLLSGLVMMLASYFLIIAIFIAGLVLAIFMQAEDVNAPISVAQTIFLIGVPAIVLSLSNLDQEMGWLKVLIVFLCFIPVGIQFYHVLEIWKSGTGLTLPDMIPLARTYGLYIGGAAGFVGGVHNSYHGTVIIKPTTIAIAFMVVIISLILL